MNKKLMAMAVAGVFAAPVVAIAQTSTVQVYGKVTFEYGYVDQGNGRPNTDILQNPGGVSVGFKGEEKLGGGLSAWFQCESSADNMIGGDGFCTRNSAIGMKGAWGNLHFGRWDTPFKRATLGMTGAGDTGLMGAANLFSGNSTGTVAAGAQDLDRHVWKRREGNTINYASPSFGGFTVLGAFSAPAAFSGDFPRSNPTDGTTNDKPRIWSLAGIYSNGPLNIGAGYERHNDFGLGTPSAAVPGSVTVTVPAVLVVGANTLPVTAFTANTAAGSGGTGGGDDRGWTIGANYTFMGKLQVGAQYIDTRYQMGDGDLKKKNWMLGMNWNIAGPHSLEAAWVRAGDSKGSSARAVNTGGGQVRAPGSGTGADLWQVGYRYAFSKRTNVKLTYVYLDNDSGSNYSLGGVPTPQTLGDSQSAFVFYGEHRW